MKLILTQDENMKYQGFREWAKREDVADMADSSKIPEAALDRISAVPNEEKFLCYLATGIWCGTDGLSRADLTIAVAES